MGDLFAKDLIEHELEGESVQTPATDLAKQKRKIHGFTSRDQRKKRWLEDKRAGKFPAELDKPYIDKL